MLVFVYVKQHFILVVRARRSGKNEPPTRTSHSQSLAQDAVQSPRLTVHLLPPAPRLAPTPPLFVASMSHDAHSVLCLLQLPASVRPFPATPRRLPAVPAFPPSATVSFSAADHGEHAHLVPAKYRVRCPPDSAGSSSSQNTPPPRDYSRSRRSTTSTASTAGR